MTWGGIGLSLPSLSALLSLSCLTKPKKITFFLSSSDKHNTHRNDYTVLQLTCFSNINLLYVQTVSIWMLSEMQHTLDVSKGR